MKKLSVVVLSIMVALYSQAQTNAIEGEIVYSIFTPQTSNTKKEAIMYFTSSTSLYIWGIGDGTEKMRTEMDGLNSMVYVEYGDKYGRTNYKNIRSHELISRNIYSKKGYIIVEELPIIDWQITDSVKSISNLECQMATCEFRGRNYEAWFTAKVSVSFGPWKLWGLPGLIVEAYDKTNEVQFLFSSLTYPSDTEYEISVPNNGELMTNQEYRNMQIKALEKLKKYYRSQSEDDVEIDMKYKLGGIELY